MSTTHLSLPLIEPAQAQKHVTHNEALFLLDAVTHLAVSYRNATSPPATPIEGQRLLVDDAPTGAFVGAAGKIATFLAGEWTFLTPKAGWRVYVESDAMLLVHDGATWRILDSLIRNLSQLATLGVGTTADAATPLAARLNQILVTAKPVVDGGSGDVRVYLNKESGARTASHIYETNYSARVEAGIIGDDHYRVKVSADGGTWRDGIIVDATTGGVSFPGGGPAKIRIFTTSASYTPSPGARLIETLLFGGGGGGGGGASSATGSATAGGAGGGGGGRTRASFAASALSGAPLSITIGAGGSGGAAAVAASTSGEPGLAGGATRFGAFAAAFGGGGGAGGQIGSGSGGGAGGSPLLAGGSGSGASGGGGALGVGGGGGGGAPAASTVDGFGSGGGGAPAAGGPGGGGGAATSAATGGGGGGGLSTANVAADGGNGGPIYIDGVGVAASGGAANAVKAGAAGGTWFNSAYPLQQAGAGGGGGAAATTSAGAGGAGGFPGGGGGGARRNGGTGGAGGAGAAGLAIIVEYF
jgi:hypothetical protein